MHTELEERVRNLIVENLQWNGSRSELSSDYDLIANHVIDSMEMLKFIPLIEEEFQITIDDTELIPDNFSTVGNVAAFVASKREQAAT